jgi:steroid delta-isomerase-like uncharacterized protein
MIAQDNAQIALAYEDAYNARDWDAAVALCAPNVTVVNVATGHTFQGAAGLWEFLEGWATAFPDSRAETTKVIADEHGAALEFIGRGTHRGPLAGPTGVIPATGRSVAVPCVEALELEQGKITSSRMYFDLAGMLQQLGLMQPPGQ